MGLLVVWLVEIMLISSVLMVLLWCYICISGLIVFGVLGKVMSWLLLVKLSSSG